tara:strand:- start:900 stop:1049 length:150 start_codon:yes stop_codon:yes gene_type:complete
MSGIHYLPEDEDVVEVKKVNEEVDSKYICNYSGLPSILSYGKIKNDEQK